LLDFAYDLLACIEGEDNDDMSNDDMSNNFDMSNQIGGAVVWLFISTFDLHLISRELDNGEH
jgi:hypothetical protein